jgi:SAM-dependent methyltransferase
LTRSTAEKVISSLVSRFHFKGSLLDLACGTGVFGRLIRKYQKSGTSNGIGNGIVYHDENINGTHDRHVGVDISPEMAQASEEAGYDQCYVGPIQEVIPRISEKFDHIVCYQAIHFVNTFELSLVLSRCFQLALKSVTIGIDEIPNEYNKRIRLLKPPANLMTSINHIQEIRNFGVPRGWKLTLEERHFGWTSPNSGVEVYTTVFHYERLN